LVSFNSIEWIAAALGLAGVLLGLRQSAVMWPCWAVSSGLYVGLMWQQRLYAQAGLMCVFVLSAGLGAWRWARSVARDEAQVRPIRWPLAGLGFFAAALLGLAIVRLGSALDAEDASLDAAVTALSLLAMALTSERYLLCWPVWGVVNLLSLALFAQQALWATTLLYAVQLLLAYLGFRAWRRDCPRVFH